MLNNEKYFGVMLDMSRNAVMTIDSLKLFADCLAKLGYNMLQLYTEDTFEVDNQPYFGYRRGKYTQQELKQFDEYCKARGIELIPCVQTLAHLNCIFRWKTYADIRDCNDILLADEDKTYEFLEDIFSSLRKCFSSDKINIGMDEAHMVGLGRYLDKHGYTNRFDILNNHLKKVISLATKYGFKPMMWSDMFFRLANNGNYYLDENSPISALSDELKKAVPENVDLIYWDYYGTNESRYENMLKSHLQFNNDIWFAGGMWTWSGFTPESSYVLKTMTPAMHVLNKYNFNRIIFTIWGDDGSETSYFSVLPLLHYFKQTYDGENDLVKIKQSFYDLIGEDYDAMMLLGSTYDIFKKFDMLGASRALLYCDLFNYIYNDDIFDGTEKSKLQQTATKLLKYAEKSKFAAYFKNVAYFYKAIACKFLLHKQISEAYNKNDKETLKKLATDIDKTIKAVKKFYTAFRDFWYSERKTCGFDVQDVRLGGLMQRLQSCKERIIDYCDGKISNIEELDEKKLPCDCTYEGFGIWRGITTSNNIW